MTAEGVIDSLDAALGVESGDTVYVYDTSIRNVVKATVLGVDVEPTGTFCRLSYPSGACPTVPVTDVRRTHRDALLLGGARQLSDMRKDLNTVSRLLVSAFNRIEELAGQMEDVTRGPPPDPDTVTHIDAGDNGLWTGATLCGHAAPVWNYVGTVYDDENARRLESENRPWCRECERRHRIKNPLP